MGDLHHWRSFLAVHRARSVSAAARSLGTAQSTVTGHIQALEGGLGERLFDRGHFDLRISLNTTCEAIIFPEYFLRTSANNGPAM